MLNLQHDCFQVQQPKLYSFLARNAVCMESGPRSESSDVIQLYNDWLDVLDSK